MANVKATDLITFTRASKGHALRKVSYGSELLSNSDFDGSVTGFQAVGGATIAYDATEGGAEVTVTGSGGGIADAQIVSVTVGKMYQISVTLKKTTFSGDLHIQADGVNIADITPTTDYKTFVANVVATDTDLNVSVPRKSSPTGIFFITNFSVKEVTLDQADGTLQLFEHPDNIPRIEYDASGNVLGLLIEEARTNLLIKSDAKDWFASGATLSPISDTTLGAFTGVTVITGGGTWNRAYGSLITVTSGTTYVVTAFFKYGTSNEVRLNFRDQAGAQETRINGSAGNLAVDSTLAGTATILSEEALPNNVRKVVVQYVPDFSGNFEFGIGPNSTTVGETVIALAAQVEQASFGTSYIKTTGNTAGRSADVASIDLDRFGYNQSQGTLFVDFNGIDDSSVARIGAIHDGTSNNTYTIQQVNGNTTSGRVRIGGTDLMFSNLSAVTTGKAALVYSDEYAQYALNGFANSPDTTVATATMSILAIGNLNGTNVVTGHIKSLNYYPKRLSNATLQEITS